MSRQEEISAAYDRLLESWGSDENAFEKMNKLRQEYRQLVFDDHIAKGELEEAISFCGSEEVAGVIVKLAPAMSTKLLREILLSEWTRCEAHQPYREDFVKLFRKVGFISDVDVMPSRVLNAKQITIYRGNLGEQETNGISWTLSRKQAEWFASFGMSFRAKHILGLWREDGIPTVWRATVPHEGILAYFDGRTEKEVVVDPATLKNVIRIAEAREVPA